MRIAYFDCFAGASGDMILAALIDAGLDPEDLRRELGKLPIGGYELRFGRAMKQHIDAADVDVVVHEHVHERKAAEIEAIVAGSALDPEVRTQAARIVRRLAEVEAHIHGTTVEQIHLHEVGGVDCIVDICGAVIGLKLLGIEKVFCSPLPVSRGFVTFSHGTWPVPGPAALELTRGVPLVPLELDEETLTPTGAAILTTVSEGFGYLPAMRLEEVGYGAGKKTFTKPIPNVVRLMVGESTAAPASGSVETLTLLETNIDDMPAEWFEHAMERLFAAGALDVTLVPAQMKKNRPATILSVLCRPAEVNALLAILFGETTTLGVRESRVTRHAAGREMRQVETPWGPVPVKVASWGGRAVTFAPEYEVCRRVAREQNVPLKDVYAAATAAARSELPATE